MASKYNVLLPKTKFPSRTKYLMDNSIRAAAGFDKLYKWQLENRDPSKTFVLHDGPPYANGPPHMGHALNKILKDIINRYKLLRGYRVLYKPGWDCHGLPIELKACRDDAKLTAPEIRSRAAKFAKDVVEDQKKAFVSWGCLGDWDNPYLTMENGFEAKQIQVFYDMYRKGCIYRGFKPVYWSPSTRTALAEAELEYKDHVSKSVYVLFPLVSNSFSCEEEVSAVVWTTTPWTLIANKAICYHPNHTYSVLRVQGGELRGKVVLVGSKHLDKMEQILGECEVLETIAGSRLEGTSYTNPIDRESTGFAHRPFLPGEHVSEEEGTGLVHTAPAHGFDDYFIGLKHNLVLDCMVDGDGKYTKEAGEQLQGRSVLREGNEDVILSLAQAGTLVHQDLYTHRYPYDWRSKKPVIIRATEQWFASVKLLKEQARTALTDQVIMYPPKALNRLLSMLEGREDWCISRQRVWGVPLPVFYHKGTGQVLVTDETISHIQTLFSKHGANCWWEMPTAQLLPASLLNEADNYTKGQDTMDVWFDSGSSWATVLKETEGVADMYLEGSDQHRGWFQSSLLTSVAVRGKSPYRVLVTHGFVLDRKGEKMSKSLGNVTSPSDILDKKRLGADVMRLWVASSDYSNDVQISNESLEQSCDRLQKIRNSCRYMLGNLANFNPSRDGLPYDQLSKLDKYCLHLLSEYNQRALLSYESLSFSSLCLSLASFISIDLSAFYFDIVKDRLYCDSVSSERRKSIQTVLSHLLVTLVHSFGPLAPHLAEEVAMHHPMETSVFKSLWAETPAEWNQPDLYRKMEVLRSILLLGNKALNSARSAKVIGSPLEAAITIHTNSDSVKTALSEITVSQQQRGDDFEHPLSDYFIVSDAVVSDKPWMVGRDLQENRFLETVREDECSIQVEARRASDCRDFSKCPRCRKWVCQEGEDLCGRCAEAEGEPQRFSVQE